MVQRQCLVVLLLAAVLSVFPSRANAQESWASEHLSYRIQSLGYHDEHGVRKDSLLNPGNSFARVPLRTSTAELRVDLRLKGIDWVTISLKPRIMLEGREIDVRGAPEDNAYDYRIFARQWMVEFFATREFSISFGRDIPSWGPANFRSPSNPFYFNNGRANPLRELDGIDVVRMSFAPMPGCSLTLLHKLGNGGNNLFKLEPLEKQLTMYKIDYSVDIVAFSASVYKRWDERAPDYAGFLQVTTTEALLLYVEGDVRFSSDAMYPRRDPSAPFGGVFERSSRPSAAYTGLLGASYTLRSGHTLYAEYLYNSEGYETAESELRFDLADRAGRALVAGQNPAVAARTIAAALGNNLRLQSQHYLFLQAQSPQGEDFMWQVRSALNCADWSGQVIGYVEWNALERISLYGIGMAEYGSLRTEYRSLLTYAITAGLRAYL